MELRLKGYGTIEITNAVLVDGGDIMIEAADCFEGLAKTTDYDITEVFLVENDFGWDLIAWLSVPDDDWFAQRTIIFEIEDSNVTQRLSAFL